MAFKIDNTTAVSVMPTPGAAGTAGWFTDGNPGTGVPGTVVTADWLNSIQGEIISVLAAAGITPDKTTQSQLLAAIQKINKIKLTADLTLYVATTGSDTTNNGLAVGTPFATIQKAWNTLIANYDLNGFNVIIKLADGTYTAGLQAYGMPVGYTAASIIRIRGNTTTPANCIISVAGACILAVMTRINVDGLKLIGSGTGSTYSQGGCGLYAVHGGIIGYSKIDFGACGNSHMAASNGGQIISDTTGPNVTPITISGGAMYHITAGAYGIVQEIGCTVTLTGTPAFSQSFAYANIGFVAIYDTTFVGSATGSRYAATNLGYMSVNGNSTTYLPGNAAGSTGNGGVYS